MRSMPVSTGRDKTARDGRRLRALAVLAQAGIGIMTLIRGVPIELALLHQAVALVVLTPQRSTPRAQ